MTEHFDLKGAPDANGQPNLLQLQSLMRNLFAERFGLKMHHEQRVLPIYALIVAKGGIKMVESRGDPNLVRPTNPSVTMAGHTTQMEIANMRDLMLMMSRLESAHRGQNGAKGPVRLPIEVRVRLGGSA